LLTPVLLDRYGPRVAFGVPGIVMLVAIVTFWLGRNRYKTVPPAGWSKYKKELASPEGKKAMKNIALIYLFVAMFWALFEQGGSSWVLQSKQMDRIMDLRFWIFQYDWLRFEVLPAQLKALNPVLVLTLIPIFQRYLFPWVDKFFKLSPLRKMTVGMVMTALSFAIAAIIEERLQAGIVVGIGWYFWMELAMTIAEIFVSVTGLEFSYTQAPNSMKSIIMGMWFLTITVGNTFTAGINFLIEFLRKSGTHILQGGDYYWFFVISMLINTVIFAFVAYRYKEEHYIQTHGEVRA
jgi:POT family proton-dependent oligopeptide transporter